MKKIRRLAAVTCVGLSLGAMTVVFVAPAEGGARFRGYCNHGESVDSPGKSDGKSKAGDKRNDC